MYDPGVDLTDLMDRACKFALGETVAVIDTSVVQTPVIPIRSSREDIPARLEIISRGVLHSKKQLSVLYTLRGEKNVLLYGVPEWNIKRPTKGETDDE